MANNKNTKVPNVPNLRFPEFEGEWEKIELQDIVPNIYSGKDKISNSGKVVLYGSTGVIGKTDFASYKKNIVLVARVGANAGQLQIGNAPCGVTDNTLVIDAKEWNYYIYYFLQHYNLNRLVFGSGQPLITGGMLKKIKVGHGNKVERIKITRLLCLLDKRIATQNKIIERYESLIRGIVDAIILRKPKNAVIGDVCLISKQIRAEAKIDDIITVRLHGNGVCKSNAENLQLGATQYYHRKAGQLIYGKQNFHNGAIGIVPIALDKGITSKDIPSFDIDNSKCNSMYLLAQLLSPKFYKPSEALTTGTGSKRLKEENFLKMPIVLPSKEEQDNIADLIDRITMRLDQAKRMLYLFSAQKQYLLRQMFI